MVTSGSSTNRTRSNKFRWTEIQTQPHPRRCRRCRIVPQIVLKSLPTTPNPVTNGHSTYSTQGDDDEDASNLLISSLRTQLTDLHSQLEMLNSKLISSYSRISSLEDDSISQTATLTQPKRVSNPSNIISVKATLKPFNPAPSLSGLRSPLSSRG